MAELVAGFPDLSFEIVSEGATTDTVAAEWLMRGTNTGSLRGAPLTGASVALPGADVITVEDGAIRSVRGYFDRQAMLEQLGPHVVVQPPAAGPVSFGTSIYVQPGRPTRPGAVSLTWIDARSDTEALEIQTTTRRDILPELSVMPGFLSTVIARAGNSSRSAPGRAPRRPAGSFEAAATVRRAALLPLGARVGGAHRRLGAGAPESLWVRCPSCAAMVDYDRAEGGCPCGETLPRTSLW
jgi:SnoaL-like polyketide cyclase